MPAGRFLLSFHPHLLPVNRGILSTLYARLTQKTTTAELLELFRRFYEKVPFVRIYREGSIPIISSVKGTISATSALSPTDGRDGSSFSCLDNLVKGASGQGVQYMN